MHHQILYPFSFFLCIYQNLNLHILFNFILFLTYHKFFTLVNKYNYIHLLEGRFFIQSIFFQPFKYLKSNMDLTIIKIQLKTNNFHFFHINLK